MIKANSAIMIMLSLLLLSCSSNKTFDLIKTETPMYTEGYFSWYTLNQEEIFEINDIIFEGEYIESEYYTLKYDHIDYFDGIPDIVPMEHHYTILKFKITQDYIGNINYKDEIVYIAERNYLNFGDDSNFIKFENNKNYLIFAEDINKYAGDELPINSNNFPASYITVSEQFVFYTNDDIVQISDSLIEFEQIPEEYIRNITMLITIGEENQRLEVEKTYTINKISDLYEYYRSG